MNLSHKKIKWIWQWNADLIQVIPSESDSKEECEAFAFKWLRPAGADDTEAKKVFDSGKAVRVGDFHI